MIRLLRILGILMILAGIVVLLSYLITPLQVLWMWFQKLPLPIQISLGVACAGFLLVLGTLLWERFEDRATDRELLEEDQLLAPEKQKRREEKSS
jgi:hypothetical protein